jgi:hypothetical protein
MIGFLFGFFFQILPLSKTAFKNVAIIGPNAQEHQNFVNNYGPDNMPIITVAQVWGEKEEEEGKWKGERLM